MNFKVISYSPLNCSKCGDHLIVEQPIDIKLKELNENWYVNIHISTGAEWDGLSIPSLFRWFLPVYDETNMLYNISGLVHDALYASEKVSKPAADDIIRSILRDCGISRFKAGCVHRAVLLFAESHYGKINDKYNLREYVDLTIDAT